MRDFKIIVIATITDIITFARIKLIAIGYDLRCFIKLALYL